MAHVQILKQKFQCSFLVIPVRDTCIFMMHGSCTNIETKIPVLLSRHPSA
ncbi:hypothetical protein [Wolbachia pipientis]|nr:hypothetical protein [Wolbachia pipientis]MBA8754188.1 hypothetical protein [Wolbachia pipientis]